MEFSKYRWVICPRCEGEAKVDHPVFSNGITQSEWADWEPEEREKYFAGAYDVTCPECKGRGSVQEPDVARMSFAEKRVLVEKRRERRADREIERMYQLERTMGA